MGWFLFHIVYITQAPKQVREKRKEKKNALLLHQRFSKSINMSSLRRIGDIPPNNVLGSTIGTPPKCRCWRLGHSCQSKSPIHPAKSFGLYHFTYNIKWPVAKSSPWKPLYHEPLASLRTTHRRTLRRVHPTKNSREKTALVKI